MKGVLMKVGQLVSFIAEGLPDEAQAALATLQADAAPMAPTLAAEVVARRARRPTRSGCSAAGRTCRSPRPASARSTGPRPPGRPRGRRQGAVPGRRRGDRGGPRRRRGDVQRVLGAGAQRPRRPRASSTSCGPGCARSSTTASRRATSPSSPRHFAGHPWVRIPALVPELSHERVLTTEWIDGHVVGPVRGRPRRTETKQRAGEVIWRFGQHSIQRLGAFNGDPHPGNYRFHHDGSVTFLDFGLVKRWDARRVGAPRAEPRRDRRAPRPRAARRRRWRTSGFLADGHGLDPQHGLRLRVQPVPAVPRRRVHVHPRLDARHARLVISGTSLGMRTHGWPAKCPANSAMLRASRR